MIKKLPIRKCVSCGAHKPKEEFLIVVRPSKSSNDTQLKVIDGLTKKHGRGAYICKNIDCIQKAYKSKRIDRVFKKQIDPDIYKTLQEAVIINAK